MFLHDCPTAEIWQDNVLARPHFKEKNGSLKTFDFVVANPPFSFKAWSTGFHSEQDEFNRFKFGIPPKKNGDYAFLLHILACLKSNGKAAVNLPHGVLFRGSSEGVIRREIIKRGYIKGIIGLPPNLFYGTGIPACIVVLDMENAQARKGIFMVDASKGFMKDGNKNRLRAQDIHKIVDIFNRQVELPRYSRMVPVAEITDPKNDYNLNLPRYIDSAEPEDLQDIDAHLRGGIPDRDLDALDPYWDVFPGLRTLLFEPAERPHYRLLKLPAADINAAIFGHEGFKAFNDSIVRLFGKWRSSSISYLRAIKPGDHPKALIEKLSEDLLHTFRAGRLVDAYDVYQHLMDYWDAVMQDDVYLLVREGWAAILEGEPNTHLIPQPLIVQRYFKKEQAAIEHLQTTRDAISHHMEELDEEHSGEDGLFADARTAKGKLTKKSVKDQLVEIGTDADAVDEHKLLKNYLKLIDEETAASKDVKDAQRTLDTQVIAKYTRLKTDEIKTLVIEDKWFSQLDADVHRELDRVSQTLTGRIRQLAERYATPLRIWLRSPPAWADILRRWERYGTEARLQAGRRGHHPEGLG